MTQPKKVLLKGRIRAALRGRKAAYPIDIARDVGRELRTVCDLLLELEEEGKVEILRDRHDFRTFRERRSAGASGKAT